MEKIQIQFNESDYKIYYNYCLKYYQIHDMVRKQSIHAFLDLFEKGFIPVEAHDILQARELLSRKCDDFKKEHTGTSEEGDTTMLLQMRVCSDVLLFIEDLEKIYRLIQKQGVVANYLMILGTFSKVIAEGKSSQISIKYNLKREVIESLARPLTDIVQLRLGTDREWRSVLRELTFIAARFNQHSSELKFDLDIIQIVAPAVVSHFNKDVKTREILSEAPSFFEECELEEFEGFLNQTPDLLKDDQEANINWDAIYEPLKVVSGAVAAQRDQWNQYKSKIYDQYSLTPPPDVQSPDGAIYPVGTMSPSFAGVPQDSENKKFDITVSTDLTTHVESPFKGYPVADMTSGTTPVKFRIKPFIPIIIGVAIILLFVFGTMIISGDWKLMGAGNTTNSTTGTIKNVTTAKPAATTAATTAKPTATTAKPAATTAATTAKPTPTPTSTPKMYSSSDIGNHLVDIAFGSDNNKIIKPSKDLITVSYIGAYTASDVDRLYKFISQFNSYSSTTKISENVNFNSQADILLEFLPQISISQIKTDTTTSVYKNVQTGTYYFIRTSEKTYVNSDFEGNEQDRWILRALLYNLGFYGETVKYSDSLFYAGTNNVSQLSDIDLKALQLMYGKIITNGMTKSTVKSTLSL